MAKRTRAWHEALTSVRVPFDAPTPQMEERFKLGRDAHRAIEAKLHKIRWEQANTFSDPSLDFDIVYHADLFDAENSVVYDIKPAAWLANNLGYCLAQISGYGHFLGAKACGFVQYERKGAEIAGPWVTWVPDALVVPWARLKEIAMTSDQLLAAEGNL